MQGIQPQRLSGDELLKYAQHMIHAPLPLEWSLELYARLDKHRHGVLPPEYESMRAAAALKKSNTD
jgi:hypothetical protein